MSEQNPPKRTRRVATKRKPEEIPKKQCLKCLKSKKIEDDFFQSNSENHADGRYPVCKVCVKGKFSINTENQLSDSTLESVQTALLEMNRPFIYEDWLVSIEETQKTKRELFGTYIKNLMLNKKELTWKDSEFESKTVDEDVGESTEDHIDLLKEQENKNKVDVIRMLGYDPFEYESDQDKRHLYNKLVDFLDESALEDGFKLQACIEIVKGFNQIDKINNAITNITNDTKKLSTNAGGINSLVNSKKNILASLLNLAKDNGISVNHNNNKSKGAGTLSGIIKTLQEKGFEEASVNLFDIETAQGMRQVADLSNKSIVAQLQFDENDYTSMILEQREIIQGLKSKNETIEEENRLLKKEMFKYKGGEV